MYLYASYLLRYKYWQRELLTSLVNINLDGVAYFMYLYVIYFVIDIGSVDNFFILYHYSIGIVLVYCIFVL